jgi:hypothetical protein
MSVTCQREKIPEAARRRKKNRRRIAHQRGGSVLGSGKRNLS